MDGYDACSSSVGRWFVAAISTSSQTKESENRIVGGLEARQGEFPWMVFVSIGNNFCGGTVIHRKFVLTAAHCLYVYGSLAKSSDIRVFTERHHVRESPGHQHSVSKCYVHPHYQVDLLVNDIAILELQDSLAFTSRLSAVELPNQSLHLSQGTMVVATGWGKLASGHGVGSKTLQKVSLPIITISQCKRLFKDVKYPVRSTNLCTRDLNGKDACGGDSGGPLLLWSNNKYVQVGITTWGKSCGDPQYPGVWTRVAHYVPWIKQITEKAEVPPVDFAPKPASVPPRPSSRASSRSDGKATPTTSGETSSTESTASTAASPTSIGLAYSLAFQVLVLSFLTKL